MLTLLLWEEAHPPLVYVWPLGAIDGWIRDYWGAAALDTARCASAPQRTDRVLPGRRGTTPHDRSYPYPAHTSGHCYAAIPRDNISPFRLHSRLQCADNSRPSRLKAYSKLTSLTVQHPQTAERVSPERFSNHDLIFPSGKKMMKRLDKRHGGLLAPRWLSGAPST